MCSTPIAALPAIGHCPEQCSGCTPAAPLQCPACRPACWPLQHIGCSIQAAANPRHPAAVRLPCLQAWVVTGTPITSRLEEIRGLAEFLDLRPFYGTKGAWGALLAHPFAACAAAGLRSMRALLQVSWTCSARAAHAQFLVRDRSNKWCCHQLFQGSSQRSCHKARAAVGCCAPASADCACQESFPGTWPPPFTFHALTSCPLLPAAACCRV
jgi:hypothetical protein